MIAFTITVAFAFFGFGFVVGGFVVLWLIRRELGKKMQGLAEQINAGLNGAGN